MKTSLKSLIILSNAIIFATSSATAASIHANNISALNINMLTDVFMSYTNHSERLSDSFNHHKIYGSMDRFDEYGDDGSTIKTSNIDERNKYFITNAWVNANHINADMRYGQNISQRGRFNLATVGANTLTSDLVYGKISFGGFASYTNTKMPVFRGDGDAVGLFANYKYRNFNAKTLATIGALNNSMDNMNFNNSWVNFAVDFANTLKIDETFLVRPNVYVGYTFVSSDDLYINGDIISSKDYNFVNVSPALTFVKEIDNNWYGSLSAKYVAHFSGKNDIFINGTGTEGLYLDNHTDIGINVEYDFKHLAFEGQIHKQLGGLDGWSTNINIKYTF